MGPDTHMLRCIEDCPLPHAERRTSMIGNRWDLAGRDGLGHHSAHWCRGGQCGKETQHCFCPFSAFQSCLGRQAGRCLSGPVQPPCFCRPDAGVDSSVDSLYSHWDIILAWGQGFLLMVQASTGEEWFVNSELLAENSVWFYWSFTTNLSWVSDTWVSAWVHVA